MKGLIFNELLEMVDEKFGYEMVDKIITDSDLPNDGAYTSVGTYPHSEMVSLVANLSKQTNIMVPELLETFGKYVFKVFTKSYSKFVNSYTNSFELLSHVEDTIHEEVLKLYPEAQLPSIVTEVRTDNEMSLIYKSSRAMSDLAKGLIYGFLNHFNEDGEIKELPIKKDKTEVEFILTMKV
jgi:hypothetical protein